jgi:hypothetical protein
LAPFCPARGGVGKALERLWLEDKPNATCIPDDIDGEAKIK